MNARRLEPDLIRLTAARMRQRIAERFPDAGLTRVAEELCAVADTAGAMSERLARPYWWLRAATTFVVGGLAFGASPLLELLQFRSPRPSDLFAAVQGVDSALQILGVLAAGLFFLVTFEDRLKRRRALRALHELRSIIHVVDMHQLTKDPSISAAAARTTSSPERNLSPLLLARYLDYCSELLSLCSKLAALYAQSMPDTVVTDAVSDLERLTANMSLKIWQKIAIIEQTMHRS